MSNQENKIDRILRETVEGGSMTGEESAAVWSRIETEMAEPETTSETNPIRDRYFRGMRAGLAFAAVAAIALVTVVALSPWSSSEGGGNLSLAKLSAASASEVLTLTAESAADQPSLVPGPGEDLYFRLVWTTAPSPGAESSSRLQTAKIEEWLGADGRGLRLDEVHSSSSASSGGDIETSPDRIKFDANRLERSLMASDSWRALFTLDQLYAMPTEPDKALAYIRDAVNSSVTGGGAIGAPEAGIVGYDFLVYQSVASMLMQAPLTGEQRAGLYELLADTPQWFRQEGTASVEVKNQGRAESRDGREGILIEADMRLSEVEAAIIAGGERAPRFEVLLDPESGSVLETRVAFGPNQPPSIWTTSQALEIVPAK